ncbi:lysine-specific demethylase 4 [Fusarium mundagurra]|uniref:Lysine-specific demethylase 4 n=1 Tax=Fusarium mundagurra TaxID=1567541 RepID=A0A8H5Y8D8_9HYPO|nr:lysine-specific demethylase 4 [Fusarium mundagurra]
MPTGLIDLPGCHNPASVREGIINWMTDEKTNYILLAVIEPCDPVIDNLLEEVAYGDPEDPFFAVTGHQRDYIQDILRHEPEDIPYPKRLLVSFQGFAKSKAEYRPISEFCEHHPRELWQYLTKHRLAIPEKLKTCNLTEGLYLQSRYVFRQSIEKTFKLKRHEMGIHLTATLERLYQDPEFQDQATFDPPECPLPEFKNRIKLDRLNEDDHVIHTTSFHPFHYDPDNKLIAIGSSSTPGHRFSRFPWPEFTLKNEKSARKTVDEAKGFLNDLTNPQAIHFRRKINTYSGMAENAVFGYNLLHPGQAKFLCDDRPYRHYYHLGSRYSLTTMHVEDNLLDDLPERSANCGLCGEKIWLTVPEQFKEDFERMVKRLVGLPEDVRVCPHIPYEIKVQRRGDVIFTKPQVYHMVVCTMPSLACSMNFNLPSEEAAAAMKPTDKSEPACPECGSYWKVKDNKALQLPKITKVLSTVPRQARESAKTSAEKRTWQGTGATQSAKKAKLSIPTRPARVADINAGNATTDLEDQDHTDTDPEDQDLTDINMPHDGEVEAPLGDEDQGTATDQEPSDDPVCPLASFLLSLEALVIFTQLLSHIDEDSPTLPVLQKDGDTFTDLLRRYLKYYNTTKARGAVTRYASVKIFETGLERVRDLERQKHKGKLVPRNHPLYDTPSIPAAIKKEIEGDSGGLYTETETAVKTSNAVYHEGKKWWILTATHGRGILAFIPYMNKGGVSSHDFKDITHKNSASQLNEFNRLMKHPRTVTLDKAGGYFFNEICHGRKPRFCFQQLNKEWVQFSWQGKSEDEIAELLTPVTPVRDDNVEIT